MTERLHFHFSLSCIGEGNGNPLQCSCLENPRDRGEWWAAVYGVTQSQKWLKWFSRSSSRKETRDSHPLALSVPVRTQQQAALCKPRREASLGTKSAGTLILDVELLELWEINVCCFVAAARPYPDSCYPGVAAIHILVCFLPVFFSMKR